MVATIEPPGTFRDNLGWYAEFMLKIILRFLLEKTSAGLNLKIMLNSLHIGPDHQTPENQILVW